MVADSAVPPTEPPAVTTIAWRIVHICSFLEAHGLRAVVFKRDGAAWDVPTPVPKTAALALDALANAITLWQRDLAGLDDVRLWEPLGPAAGPFGDSPWRASSSTSTTSSSTTPPNWACCVTSTAPDDPAAAVEQRRAESRLRIRLRTSPPGCRYGGHRE
jgi:hypothetical protein